MFSKIVSTVPTGFGNNCCCFKTCVFFDVLFWMAKSGTLVPHDLFLRLKNAWLHFTIFPRGTIGNKGRSMANQCGVLGGDPWWAFGFQKFTSRKQLKQPYMARVNVLDPKGGRSQILVTNDRIPQITGDVPVCRTKGPQSGYLPQNDSFIVRTTSAWRGPVRVREKPLTCQETSGRPFSLRLWGDDFLLGVQQTQSQKVFVWMV